MLEDKGGDALHRGAHRRLQQSNLPQQKTVGTGRCRRRGTHGRHLTLRMKTPPYCPNHRSYSSVHGVFLLPAGRFREKTSVHAPTVGGSGGSLPVVLVSYILKATRRLLDGGGTSSCPCPSSRRPWINPVRATSCPVADCSAIRV